MTIKAHTQNTYMNDCHVFYQHNRTIDHNNIITIGIDEVGRGSLFGQMTVGAVILDNHLVGEFDKIDLSNTPILMINDSKKLSKKKRDQLFLPIKQICQSCVIVDIPEFVIDDIDIYQATLLGMRLAIEKLIIINEIKVNNNVQILIDGNAVPILSNEFVFFQDYIKTIVKGDGIHTAIACASILAKVHRDNCMNEFAKIYPNYGFDKHKGYASKFHINAIYKYGILKEHRKSFNPIRTMLENKQGNLF